MATYNIKIQQAGGTSSNLYRPETAAKYCYVSSDVSSLFGYNKETPIEDIISLNAQDNLYWWEKKTSSWSGNLGSSTTFEMYSGSSSSATTSVQYSSSYSIDSSTGAISLSGSITSLSLSYSDYTAMNSLKGKYFLFSNNGSHGNGAGTVFLFGTSSYMDRDYYGSSNRTYYLLFKNINPVKANYSSSTEYLNSTNSSSYPIYNNSNGIVYRYLGQPSNLFKRSAKIIQRSWVGTGSRNATITFEYWPLLVFFGGNYAPITTSSPVTNNYYYFDWQSSDGMASAYWSADISYSNSSPQLTVNLNTAGKIYYYTAIC